MIVLASNSPRRRQLLKLGGWDFQVIPAGVDEGMLAGEAPPGYVLRLSQEKAHAAAPYAPPGSTVIAADTTVVLENRILGKPESPAEAVEMLEKLRRRRHQVFSGVAVLLTHDLNMLTGVCATDVLMRDYSDVEIRAYVETGDPLDKAGAYAIQHPGFQPVDREAFGDCFANVMGLPLCHLLRRLRELGVEPATDLPAECQAFIQYQCPVFEKILLGAE